MKAKEKPSYGNDDIIRVRVPSDLPPRIQAFARQRGLTLSSYVRYVIIKALDESDGTIR